MTNEIEPADDGMMWRILGGFAAAKFFLHLLTANVYGIFRDEFYYVACAKHLAWGYVDHPPLSIAILSAVRGLIGDSQLALRLVPALAGAATVLMIGLIARRLGGGWFAVALSCLAALVAPVYLAIGSFYSMNVFDQLLWACLLYIFAGIAQGGGGRQWLLFGVLAGIGLLNKVSVLFLGFGLVVALILTPERRHFRDKYLYLGGGLALLIFLPHLLWQMVNGWPTLEFTVNAATSKNAPVGLLGFFMAQVLLGNPFLLPLWVGGVGFALWRPALPVYRVFAIFFVSVFLLLALTYGKDYYLGPAYAAAIPLGALAVEKLARSRPRLRMAYAGVLVVSLALLAPLAMPVLPPATFIAYQDAIGVAPPQSERDRVGALPQHFADRFGWEELAQTMQQAVETLSPEERATAIIIGTNYGNAGALNYYREKYGLPAAFTAHNNGYLWGYGGGDGAVVLTFGMGMRDRSTLESVFTQVEEVARFSHPYNRPAESDVPIYVCRGPKVEFKTLWERLRVFI